MTSGKDNSAGLTEICFYPFLLNILGLELQLTFLGGRVNIKITNLEEMV